MRPAGCTSHMEQLAVSPFCFFSLLCNTMWYTCILWIKMLPFNSLKPGILFYFIDLDCRRRNVLQKYNERCVPNSSLSCSCSMQVYVVIVMLKPHNTNPTKEAILMWQNLLYTKHFRNNLMRCITLIELALFLKNKTK